MERDGVEFDRFPKVLGHRAMMAERGAVKRALDAVDALTAEAS